MKMTGDVHLAAPRERVWAALNDPEVLARCLPGCEELERTSESTFAAKVKAKVGPVSAKFAGTVTLSDLKPPESYTLAGEGKGGAAGFAKGAAKVRLIAEGPETRLAYEVEAKVGGKLASVGSRLIDGSAKKLTADFFAALQEEVSGAPAHESPAEPTPATAPPADLAEDVVEEVVEEGGGASPAVWVTGLLVVVLVLLAVFALG